MVCFVYSDFTLLEQNKKWRKKSILFCVMCMEYVHQRSCHLHSIGIKTKSKKVINQWKWMETTHTHRQSQYHRHTAVQMVFRSLLFIIMAWRHREKRKKTSIKRDIQFNVLLIIFGTKATFEKPFYAHIHRVEWLKMTLQWLVITIKCPGFMPKTQTWQFSIFKWPENWNRGKNTHTHTSNSFWIL